MNEHAATVDRDRKYLMVFGVKFIILAALVALVLTPLLLSFIGIFRDIDTIGMLSPEQRAEDFREKLQILLFSAITVTWMVSMGCGSIGARRWVRPLVLVVAWPWLIWGLSEATEILLSPTSASFSDWVTWRMLVTFVGAPGVLILFYGRIRLKDLCAQESPAPSWTDRCSLPALVLAFLPFVWLTWSVMFDRFGLSIPFYWAVPEGAARLAVVIVFLAAITGLFWGSYRERGAAWWGMVAYIFALATSESIDAYIGLYGPESVLDPLGPRVLSSYRGFGGRSGYHWIGNMAELGGVLLFLLYTGRRFSLHLRENPNEIGPACAGNSEVGVGEVH